MPTPYLPTASELAVADGTDYETRLANARLRAKAPDLLECLVSLTTTQPVDNHGRRSYKLAYNSMIRQARAAIAAATED